MGRRVLVTGLGTFWGGRLAQALESDPGIDVIVGLDTREPRVRLERTEFVRTDESYSILARLVRATKVDTVLHTFLVVDPGAPEARRMHEINVIGTMNLCAAVCAPGSAVRTLVLKSFTGVYGSAKDDPALFSEDTARSDPPRHRSERSLIEVEQYVADLALDHPETTVSILRFCNVLGPSISTTLTKLLDMPLVPSVLGFDPLLQFVHEDDVVRALRFAMEERLDGTFNVAGKGLLPWSEVAAMAGKRLLPLPPLGTAAMARLLRMAGAPPLPAEALDLLRFGRGVDGSRFRRAGFTYLFDTAGAVADHVGALRLRRAVGAHQPDYRFEGDVEAFFRHSPAVLSAPESVDS
jgi:UDP-glucose 4-epimerase